MAGRGTRTWRDYRTLSVEPGRLVNEIVFVLRCIWLHPANRGRLLGTLLLGSRSRIWVPRRVYGVSRALTANPSNRPEYSSGARFRARRIRKLRS